MAETQQPVVTAEALREKLGVSAGHASDVASKKTPPSLKLAFQIKRELGVPVDHWEDVALRDRPAA